MCAYVCNSQITVHSLSLLSDGGHQPGGHSNVLGRVRPKRTQLGRFRQKYTLDLHDLGVIKGEGWKKLKWKERNGEKVRAGVPSHLA